MKKKILLILTAFATLILLAGCQNGHKHLYLELVTPPTCTEKGYTTHTCSCGDAFIDGYLDELGHKFGEYISDGNATYDTDGTKTAVCTRQGCNEKDTLPDEGSKLKSEIVFKSFSVDGNSVNGGKVGNSVAEISLENEIIASGQASYILSQDENGELPYPTNTVTLEVGDNVFYILEQIDGETTKIYTLTIRRKEIYTVKIDEKTGDADGVYTQTVEEDGKISAPVKKPERSGYSFDGWDYDFNLPITGNTEITAKWLAIFTVYGKNITGVTEHGKTLSKIEIPYSIDGGLITTIEDYAFENCLLLKELTLGNAVTTIGWYAFYGCNQLQTITLGASVKSIGDEAFYGCSALTKIAVHTGNVNYQEIGGNLYTKDGKTLVKFATNKSGEFTIPESVLKIGDYAFKNAVLVTKITLQESVEEIGDEAFYGCSALTELTPTNGVTEIGNYAFYNCKNLRNYILSDGITEIGKSAFYGCVSLSYTEKGGLKYIGSANNPYLYLVGVTATDIKSAVIDDECYIIALSAFENCSVLTDITIGKSVRKISGSLFENCRSLLELSVSSENGFYQSVAGNLYTKDGKTLVRFAPQKAGEFTLPSGVTKIESSAFKGATALTKVDCNEVLEIGGSAFKDCTALTEIRLKSVQKIGSSAFENCTLLKTVAIGDSVTKIGSAVFKGCVGLTEITVSNENTSYQSIDGNLYSKDGKIFIQYALGKNGAFVLPDTVKEIALSAFEGSITLTKVTIGNSVSKIGNYAFKGCTALTEVVIGNGVKEIGYWAFDGCVTLTTLAYQGTKSKWNAITKGSFWNQGVPATIVRCENGEIEL